MKKTPYIPVPDTPDIFSVETIPLTNARAAFVTKTSEVFRESGHLSTKTVGKGIEYVPWGEKDDMPYEIIRLIEQDETLATCQNFNSEVCYGSGLRYCTQEATEDITRAVDEFLEDNPLPDYFLGVCQDLKYFNFAISVIVLNGDGSRIVELHRKPACYCRFAPADPKTGQLTKVIFAPFRTMSPDSPVEVLELLDPRSPWKDLQMRMGLRMRDDGSK